MKISIPTAVFTGIIVAIIITLVFIGQKNAAIAVGTVGHLINAFLPPLLVKTA